MGFLIKTCLFLGIVILFIPADESETRKLAGGQSVSVFEAFGFAAAAYSDAKGFCGRNPDACQTGGVALSAFEAKARTGARWIYATLDPSAPKPAADADAELPSAKPAVGPSVPPTLATGSVSIARPGEARTYLPLPPAKRPS